MKARKRLAGLLAAFLLAVMIMNGAALADGVTVTADKLNVRARPDAESALIGVARSGEELSFVSEYGSWIQVKFKGLVGFISSDYAKLDMDDLAEDVRDNTEACLKSGVTTERVNIRTLPMTSASVVTVAAKKATVQIIGVCGEWYQVKYGSKTGYLISDYVSLTVEDQPEAMPKPTTTPKPTATPKPTDSDEETIYEIPMEGRITVRVNLRTGPSTEKAVIAVLDEDKRVSVIGETKSWYRIIVDGEIGYIVKTCVKFTEEDDGSSDGDAPSSGETIYSPAKNGVATARVNMRKDASTSAGVVTVLSKGQKVTVEGEKNGWYKVSLGSKSGYVSGSYLMISTSSEGGTVQPEETAKPETDTSYDTAKSGRTTTRVNMRSEASTGSAVLTVLSSGAKITLTGEKGSFYQAEYGRYTGYVAKSYVRIIATEESNPGDDEGETGEVIYSDAKSGTTTARVNLRSKPDGSVLKVLALNAKVSVLGENGSWYKVKYGSTEGYVSKSYVRVSDKDEEQTEGEGTKGYISGSSVNVRSGPGTGYGVVKVLKLGTEIRFYSLTDGWYLIKVGSVTGYVSHQYVSKTEPEESESSTVILSDWFKGEIQNVYGRGVEAVITDVKTGLKFKATRTGGIYHADAQPTTSSDTKTMYKIYGNDWKWDRRAIWVTVGSKTYAASMNGMPHGETDTIPGNDFDGVFCIHFLNSKTHEGDRVDSGHQDCIIEAYEAGK